MFQNYLRIALRNVQKHKGYAFINIAGLAIGMACSILIVAYILTELSYDRFHEKADRIYRVAVDGTVGGKVIKVAISNAPLAPVLKQDYPEVLSAVRLWPAPKKLVKHKANQFYEKGILFADSSFFNVFTFPMIKGDPESALVTAYTGVLTEETALKYFGDEDPIGKVLEIVEGRNFSKEFKSDQDQAIIINETAGKSFGWENPVGKTIRAPTDTPLQWETKRVIGIVKDFHMASLHKVIMPQITTDQ